jgi:hypothetical protein
MCIEGHLRGHLAAYSIGLTLFFVSNKPSQIVI